MEKRHVIYAFKDENENIFYIGKTCRIKKRKKEHLYELKKGNNLPKYNKLRKVINSGLDFEDVFLILENDLNCDEIDDREMYYISKLREEGYNLKNLTDGGDGGIMTTPNISEKIRKAHLGKKRNEETKRKISESNKGKKFTKEHIEKLIEARNKRVTKKETREKCSKTSKGKINIKKYEIIDPCGNVYFTENGLTSFCEENGLSTPNMVKVAKGERKHHKGWTIKKIDENE
jgi:group I intron endonuclease